jgi:hypothetical protein
LIDGSANSSCQQPLLMHQLLMKLFCIGARRHAGMELLATSCCLALLCSLQCRQAVQPLQHHHEQLVHISRTSRACLVKHVMTSYCDLRGCYPCRVERRKATSEVAFGDYSHSATWLTQLLSAFFGCCAGPAQDQGCTGGHFGYWQGQV